MSKSEIIAEIKRLALALSKEYKTNLKIEVNTNSKFESAKVNITEFNK